MKTEAMKQVFEDHNLPKGKFFPCAFLFVCLLFFSRDSFLSNKHAYVKLWRAVNTCGANKNETKPFLFAKSSPKRIFIMMSNIEWELAKMSQAKLESDHCEESSQAEAYFCKKILWRCWNCLVFKEGSPSNRWVHFSGDSEVSRTHFAGSDATATTAVAAATDGTTTTTAAATTTVVDCAASSIGYCYKDRKPM